ncbi:MAG: hypothetical protein JW795_16665 [Chitinivibrionales bacterium]|nr:hypothetical protein [Chitinivibrionales bacterium]
MSLKMMQIPAVWIILCSQMLFAAQVGKFTYFGKPEKLNGGNLTLPRDMVAMGDFIAVKKTTSENSVNAGGASVFFIIDNSSSMYSQGNDQWGVRFGVTRALLDSLNRINPACEVGLTVFNAFDSFDSNDDPNIFVKMLPQLQTESDATMQFLDAYGSYVMLMKLNQTYQSAKVGLKSGYEILKYYLQTDTITAIGGKKYLGLKYVPTDAVLSNPTHSSGTNITVGFQAAKYAMKKAIYPPEKQFVIFFSDGDANMPAGYKDLQILFVKGTAVPTTFSFYLTPNDTTPQNIIKMTANIKSNNYSSSNKFSTLWSIRSNQDSLMSLMKANIFPIIFSTIISTTPKKLVVNTIENTSWKNNGFQYDKLFGLTGAVNPFTYLLTYAIIKDSITPNGSTQTHIKDTLANIQFKATLQTGSSTPDSTRLAYWDRTLAFLVDDKEVAWIDDKVKNIELRFTTKKIDTLYGYSGVTAEVITTNGAVKDRELVSLKEQGQTHSATVALAVGTASAGDNIVQHQVSDTIIAIFRNKELALDTLRTTVVTGLGDYCALQRGIYYDRDADGFVDHIFIGLTGQKKTEAKDIEKIAAALQLPAYRSLQKKRWTPVENGIELEVGEGNPLPHTATVADDRATIKDSLILEGSGEILLPSSVPLEDSLAPVIVRARLVDSLKPGSRDELTVYFSEKIDITSQRIPFFYRTATIDRYEAQLTLLHHQDSTSLFSVDSVFPVPAISPADSLWINASVNDNIHDALLNNQGNEKNRRCLIEVTTVALPYDLVLKASLLKYSEWITLSESVLKIEGMEQALKNIPKKGQNQFQGIMIFTLEPDNPDAVTSLDGFDGYLTLFDAIGNRVLSKQKMLHDNEARRCIYIWDGGNSASRSVGAGAYLATVSVERFVKNVKVGSKTVYRMVGVKK